MRIVNLLPPGILADFFGRAPVSSEEGVRCCVPEKIRWCLSGSVRFTPGPTQVTRSGWVRRIYTGDHRMAHMDYHLSAAQFPSGDVVLYITTGGLPSHTSFRRHRHPVARYCAVLCVRWLSGGRFDLKPCRIPEIPLELSRSKALTATTGNFSSAGRSARAPGARQPVGVGEVFRIPDHAHFSVHHWVGRMGGRSRDRSADTGTPCPRDMPGVTAASGGLPV